MGEAMWLLEAKKNKEKKKEKKGEGSAADG